MSDRLQELRDRADTFERFRTPTISDGKEPSVLSWAADEIERLRAAITEAVKTLDAEASNECMCLMVAADLTDALKGGDSDE